MSEPGKSPTRPQPCALVIASDDRQRGALAGSVEAAGLRVIAAVSPVDASTPAGELDAVVLADGSFSPEVVDVLRGTEHLLPVLVVVSRPPGLETLRAYGRARIHDIVVVASPDDLPDVGTRAAHAARRRMQRRRPRRVAEEIAGVSAKIQQVRRYIEAASRSEANVLITGESGTGKELVARAVHRHGPRADAPFVAVNCSAIPEGLLESELFGHEKGSFTGAFARSRGMFEQAHRGTLFLDEIGEMPLRVQARLLRVLQPPPDGGQATREVTRVGSETPIRVDVRVVFATHRDLEEEVAEGRFREDLLQRLNTLHVRVPPLRERREDIGLLACLFLERTVAAEGKPGTWFDEAALEVLVAYDWPLNVRELESVVRSVVAMKDGGGAVVLGELPARLFDVGRPAALPGQSAPSPTWRTLAEVELDYIQRVLADTGGNKSRAARILGLSRQSLDRRLAETKPGASAGEAAPSDATEA